MNESSPKMFTLADLVASYMAPTEPGHYWGKLVSPEHMSSSENWISTDWEVMQVHEDSDFEDGLTVWVPGLDICQPLDAFQWGPRVPDFQGV